MNARMTALACASLFGMILAGGWLTCAWAAGPGDRLDGEKIGRAAGTKATTAKGGVVRISWPRNDVPVEVDGMPLKPFAGLGSWAEAEVASVTCLVRRSKLRRSITIS